MEWTRILAYITGTVDQELLLRNEYLAAENGILKAQLKGCLRLSDAERAKLGEIGHRLGRKSLSEVATTALPDTILAWYRRLVARKFDGSRARRTPGRSRIKRSAMFCAVTVCRPHRRASTQPPGQHSFEPTWRCWRAPIFSPWRSSRCADW